MKIILKILRSLGLKSQVASTVPITTGGQELTVSDFEAIPGQQPFIQGQYNVTGVDDSLVLYGDSHMSGLYGGAGGNLDAFFDDWKSNLNPEVLTAAGLDGENWKELCPRSECHGRPECNCW